MNGYPNEKINHIICNSVKVIYNAISLPDSLFKQKYRFSQFLKQIKEILRSNKKQNAGQLTESVSCFDGCKTIFGGLSYGISSKHNNKYAHFECRRNFTQFDRWYTISWFRIVVSPDFLLTSKWFLRNFVYIKKIVRRQHQIFQFIWNGIVQIRIVFVRNSNFILAYVTVNFMQNHLLKFCHQISHSRLRLDERLFITSKIDCHLVEN